MNNMKKEARSFNITIAQLWDVNDYIKSETANIVKEITTLLKTNRKKMGFEFVKDDDFYELAFNKVDVDEDTLGVEIIFNQVKIGVLHFDYDALDEELTESDGESISDYFSSEIIKRGFFSWFDENLRLLLEELDSFDKLDERLTNALAQLGCRHLIIFEENVLNYTLYDHKLREISSFVFTDHSNSENFIMTVINMIEVINFNSLSDLVWKREIGGNIEVKIEEAG